MTPLALTLVLISAFLHATWNLLMKRAGGSGNVPFGWLLFALTALIWAPLAGPLLWREPPRWGMIEWLFIAGGSVLHVGYFLLLQRGYRTGDLSLVYPLARGTGPMLSTLAAIALLDERPTALALLGTMLIGIGVFIMVGGRAQAGGRDGGAILYALLTGTFIAAYTLWDGYAVSRLRISPLLFDWFSNLFRLVLLTPFVLGRGEELQRIWRMHRREAIGIAILSPLAYILVLVALTHTPISYVAPVRELSILIGAALGNRLLAEGDGGRRLIAAGSMLAGALLLAVG